MSGVKVTIEKDGERRTFKMDFETYKNNVYLEKARDKYILHGCGMKKEMREEELRNHLLSMIGKLDHKEQKKVLFKIAEATASSNSNPKNNSWS